MNILAERSFPTFFGSYAPKLLKFYSDWLDWTEAPGNAQYILNHLSSEQDIDESIEAYKTHHKAKLLPEFPERLSTDLKLLLKNVLWLYRSKSSRKAYDFMFRVLFNSSATIWHPREMMLKTSDGIWDIPQYVGIASQDGASVDWIIDNCLGWRMTGKDSRAEAFVAAATSTFTGSIECRASQLKGLAKVEFYSNYGEKNQMLQPLLGTLECDPTIKAFRIVNPNNDGILRLNASIISASGGEFELVRTCGSSLSHIIDSSNDLIVGIASADATGIEKTQTASFVVYLNRVLETRAAVTIDVNGREYLVELAPGRKIATLSVVNPDEDGGPTLLTAKLVKIEGEGIEDAYLGSPATIRFVDNDATYIAISSPDIIKGQNATFKVALSEPAQTNATIVASINNRTFNVDIAEGESTATFDIENPMELLDETTAVWTFNKVKRTTVFSPGKTHVDIGTKNFLEPSVVVSGNTDLYNALNLEALVNNQWISINVVASDGMLSGKVANETEDTAFVLAIEPTSEISFVQHLPIKLHGAGTDTKNLGTFFIECTKTLAHGTLRKDVTKSVPLNLVSSSLGECHLEAYDLIEKETIIASATTKLPFSHIFDWSDCPDILVKATKYEFETPVSNCIPRLSYSFDRKAYVVELDFPLERNITAICTIDGRSVQVVVPAGKMIAEATIELPDRIVTVGSRNVHGILIDTATAHFAPGEKVRLLDPETGEVSDIEPTILWYAESVGHYSSTKGFLSDINAIQDNYYYQNYSYVVRSDVGMIEWRNLVKRLIHPAGLIFFGEMLLEGELEDGSGIYYLETQDFLRKSWRFFHKLIHLSKQALIYVQNVISTSRLAQRHSITTDLWLHWMQQTGDARAEIKELKLLLFETTDLEERIELEERINELEKLLTEPYLEDIRDWYDIRPSDIDENLNANSVLFFRSDGTLIDPLIVDWVDFSFTEDIDESFEFRGQIVAPKTTSIWGTTLHPLHPMIHGRIEGNEYVVGEDQEFIPHLQMTFVGSTQESSGVLVKTLIINNEVLRYSNIQRTDLHESALVGDTVLSNYARRYLFNSTPSTTVQSNGIVPWKNLVIDNFIYVDSDGSFIFNPQSLMKVPEAWTEVYEDEQKYVYSRNAWNNEKISIVSYSPYDFSYRIWIERLNTKVECSITKYNLTDKEVSLLSVENEALPCPLRNKNISVDTINDSNGNSLNPKTNVELVHVEESGWNGAPKNVYAATTTWKMSFNNPDRVASWFDFELPGVIDPNLVLCFVNGLMKPKSSIKGNKISIDTVEDNSSIEYSSTEWDLWELQLQEYVLDDEGNRIPADEEDYRNEYTNYDGWKTKPILISTTESDNVPFGELTLEDEVVIDKDMNKIVFGELDRNFKLYDIVGCTISDTLSYAEIYILAPIEGSRRIQYPWFGWSLDEGDGQRWPFTYDNARIFQYSAHNEAITSIKDAELNPDKEAIRPQIHWEVEYHNVSRLLNGFQRENIISTTIASQRQSETVDRILDTWWNYDTTKPRLQTDFLKNEHWLASANFSSTLIFGEDGLLVDPRGFNWSECYGDGGQELGMPQKWWSRPLLAEIPVEFDAVENRLVEASSIADRGLVFVDGIKIPDIYVQKNANGYVVPQECNGGDAAVFSMGSDWLQEREGRTGYLAIEKSGTRWKVTTIRNGRFVQAATFERLESIDLSDYIGLSLERQIGTIWAQNNSTPEIAGSTEIVFANEDKRRFIDLTFLDLVDLVQPKETARLYTVKNNRLFGFVGRIVDIDPKFLMVFIDGKYSPMESHEWRYIKGTFFIEVEPQKTVEVYVGNPLSYLAPDMAKCAPEGIGAVAFNNLRVNIVPRHMTNLALWRIMYSEPVSLKKELHVEWHQLSSFARLEVLAEYWRMDIQTIRFAETGFYASKEIRKDFNIFFDEMKLGGKSIEVRWKEVHVGIFIGGMWENQMTKQTKVINMSETFDDVVYWGQMDPSAWTGIGFNALSKTGKSSIMAFNSDGGLIDPYNVDYHNGIINPFTTGNVVEILTPGDTVKTAWVYWPVYEVDPEAHMELAPDGRFKELRDTDYAIVQVDGSTYELERHFTKEVRDLHMEEGTWILPRPDMEVDLGRYDALITNADWDNKKAFGMMDESLLLTDVVADNIEINAGSTIGVAIDADLPMERNVQIVLEDGVFRIPVSRIGGELVFVDGVKIAEGSYKKRVYVDGRVAAETFGEWTYVAPEGVDVQYEIEIVDPQWKDNDEHVAVVYWPGSNWAERTTAPESIRTTIDGSLQDNWREFGFETFKEYVQSRIILFCNGKLVHVEGNADKEITLDGVDYRSYRCQSYELYIVNVAETKYRSSESFLAEHEQSFIFNNQQRNWFMEAHTDETLWRMKGLPVPVISSRMEYSMSNVSNLPVLKGDSSLDLYASTCNANNRDTLDNVFINGSIPVRQYVNPSLYVERVTKLSFQSINEYSWKVAAAGENPEDLDFVMIEVNPEDLQNNSLGEERRILLSLEEQEYISWERGSIAFVAAEAPETLDFQLYITDRENPEGFYPSEKLDSSHWKFYPGWNQRLEFFNVDISRNIYMVETLDVSMAGEVTTSDQVYWLEKEFNKKSTLILDDQGLLEHPEGLEWCNGYHIFPHQGTWTAQAEEAEFPAVVNELIPDNIKKRQVMDLCLDDVIGYNDILDKVENANLEILVALNAKVYHKKEWKYIANRDYIYWEEGEFRNWIAWLKDDDVFDQLHCFVFVNGLKIPDGVWTYDVDSNSIIIPFEERQLIERLGFVRKDQIYDEVIYEENVVATIIDPEHRNVFDGDYEQNLILDANWVIWKNEDGYPAWGNEYEVEDNWEVVVTKPDAREGIIWPIARIWKKFVEYNSAGIDVPEYLGYGLEKYTMAWVNGRLVQCRFEGTRIFLPEWKEGDVVEIYVFELNDQACVQRFDGSTNSFDLLSFRDMRVC